AASRDPGGFARLRALGEGDPGVTGVARNQTLYPSALIGAAKGRHTARPTNIPLGRLRELFPPEDAGPRANPATGRTLFYRSLRELGVLGEQAPGSLRGLRTCGRGAPG